MSWGAFVIHLERAVQRRRQAENLAASLPLPAEILSAIDGLSLSAADRARFYRRTLHAPRHPFALSDAEIACFLSHRMAWRLIIDRGLDGALVAEDDVAISGRRFAAVLTAAMEVAKPADLVRFPRWKRGERGKPLIRFGPVSIVEPYLPGLGMQMQLVGREAARLLLDATETFDRPVDAMVQMQWLHGARVLSARPIVIREVDTELGGTVLQKKTMGLVEKVSHEVRRPFLRRAIRQANAAWRRGEPLPSRAVRSGDEG